MDWENLIVTLLMTSFFVIKNQLQHFTKLTALEIKLEIMVVDVCSKVKILVMCDDMVGDIQINFLREG